MQVPGPDHERWEDAAGAYLLGALPDDERARYVAHLDDLPGLPRGGRRPRPGRPRAAVVRSSRWPRRPS